MKIFKFLKECFYCNEHYSFFPVATPIGTPSPPNAASTVARTRKKPSAIIDFETSMQYGSKFPSNHLDTESNYSRNAPQEIYADETSLGLLPYCAVEDCTLSATVSNKNGNGESSRKAIFGFSCLQPPTPEDKEPAFVKDTCSKSPKEDLMQYSDQCHYQAESVEIPKEMSRPSSKLSNYQDDSAETVIRKESPRMSPCLMMFSPQDCERSLTPSTNHSVALMAEMFVDQEPSLKTPENDFYSNDYIENINLAFDDAPSQNFDGIEDMHGAFDNLHFNNTEFINIEEHENQKEFQFMQEEEMQVSNSSCQQCSNSWTGFSGMYHNSRTESPSTQNPGEKIHDESRSDEKRETSHLIEHESPPSCDKSRKNENSSELPPSTSSLDDGTLDYFREGTSRIGKSLDDNSSPSTSSSFQQIRPTFGFNVIKSPKRIPVNVLEPEELQKSPNENSIHEEVPEILKSNETGEIELSDKNAQPNILVEDVNIDEAKHAAMENSQLEPSYHIENVLPTNQEKVLQNETSAEPIQNELFPDKVKSVSYTVENSQLQPSYHIENVLPTDQENVLLHEASSEPIKNEMCPDKVKSESYSARDTTLEQSVRMTILEDTGILVNDDTVHRIISNASPGHDPKYYASLFIEEIKRSKQPFINKQAPLVHEDTTANKSQLDSTSLLASLPSFLEDTVLQDQDRQQQVMKKKTKIDDCLSSQSTNKGLPINFSQQNISQLHTKFELTSKPTRSPNKSKHSSPIKKPPRLAHMTLKENVGKVANFDDKCLNSAINLTASVAEHQPNILQECRKQSDDLRIKEEEDIVFPIRSNKAVVNWFSTPVNGKGETQQIKLYNTLKSTALRVRVIIRDANEFILNENDSKRMKNPPRFLDIVIPADGTKDVLVSYKPFKAGVHSRGKLVLKPQLKGNEGRRNIKASILLEGFAGRAQMEFSYVCKQTKRNVKLENELQDILPAHFGDEFQLQVKNQGDTAGFVRLAAYSDNDYKPPDLLNYRSSNEPALLHAENNDVIVGPGDANVIKIKHKSSNHQFQPDRIVNFALLHGTEILRQAFCYAQRDQRYDGIAPDLSLHQDFTNFVSPIRFLAEDEFTICSENVRTFYEKLKRTDFQVRFSAPDKVFYKLSPEETINESSFFTADTATAPLSVPVQFQQKSAHETVAAGQLEVAIMSPNTRLAIFPNERRGQLHRNSSNRRPGMFVATASNDRDAEYDHKEKDTVLVSKRLKSGSNAYHKTTNPTSRNGVFLDQPENFFPAVKLNECSVTKITVKNRTKRSVIFSLNTLHPPFENYHHTVEVKPNYYLNIPVKYCPTINDGEGPHECYLKLEEKSAEPRILVSRLVGKRQ